MRLWRRAAKLGDAEAQFLAGLAAYHGSDGAAQDAESAALWLGRALRQAQGQAQGQQQPPQQQQPSTGEQTSGGPTCPTTTAPAPPTSSAPPPLPPPPLPEALRVRVLREAALILGYIHFDGEGSAREDRERACAYFRAAKEAGCEEAAAALGWAYNTGQYGD